MISPQSRDCELVLHKSLRDSLQWVLCSSCSHSRTTVLFSQQCLSRWHLLGNAYAGDTHSDIPLWNGWSELGVVPSIGFKASPPPCMATPHTCGVWGFMLLPSSGSCGERKHMTLTESLLLPCQHPDLPGLGRRELIQVSKLKGHDLLSLWHKELCTLPFHLLYLTSPFPPQQTTFKRFRLILLVL